MSIFVKRVEITITAWQHRPSSDLLKTMLFLNQSARKSSFFKKTILFCFFRIYVFFAGLSKISWSKFFQHIIFLFERASQDAGHCKARFFNWASFSLYLYTPMYLKPYFGAFFSSYCTCDSLYSLEEWVF